MMRSTPTRMASLGLLAATLLAASSAPGGASAGAPPAAAADGGAARYFAGLSLVDQDGHPLDLYRDAIENHTVVMHSFFASCTASCPVMMNTLKAAQSRLGARLGKEVRLISITVDPEHDTPAVLRQYAQRIGARPGWLFLTGSRTEVDAALQRIGQYAEEPAAHMDLMVAGNSRSGLWKKIHALASSAEVVDLIMGVVDDPVRE